MVRRALPFIIVGVVAIATLGAGVTIYRSKRPAAIVLSGEQAARGDKQQMHVRGAMNAPVTLQEFGDFQCPPCGALAGPLREIEKAYGAKLRVIFRNFPLAVHQHAMEAACAAEAAGLQARFWEMHDLLYREQGNWSKAPDVTQLFESYAGIIGLKTDRFRADMQSDKVKQRVAADQQRGSELGVKSTPTVFINNKQVPPGMLSPANLRASIDDALKATPTP